MVLMYFDFSLFLLCTEHVASSSRLRCWRQAFLCVGGGGGEEVNDHRLHNLQKSYHSCQGGIGLSWVEGWSQSHSLLWGVPWERWRRRGDILRGRRREEGRRTEIEE